MTPDIEDPEPIWQPVVKAAREAGGIRVSFCNERSGGFSYMVSWGIPIAINGVPSLAYAPDAMLAAMVGKFARLTFDPDSPARVVKAEFVTEIP